MLGKARYGTFGLVIVSSPFSTSRWRDTIAGVGYRHSAKMPTVGSWLGINLLLLICSLMAIFSGTQATKFVAFKFPTWLIMITMVSSSVVTWTLVMRCGRWLHFGGPGWKDNSSVSYLPSSGYESRTSMKIQAGGSRHNTSLNDVTFGWMQCLQFMG